MHTRRYALFQDRDFHSRLRKYKTHNDHGACVVHFHMRDRTSLQSIPMAQQDFATIIQTLHRLTPGEKLALIERLAHSLQAPIAGDQVSAVQQREALRRLRHAPATLPVHNPEDGFSNRDHDRLLYGDP